jgi:NDP-sugar pyrophosphorylase family protein
LGEATALVLAGGLGTRLRTMVADRPKALVEVGGRPFIAFLLDQLAGAGIREVVLCTGYLGEQLRERLGEQYRGLRLSYSQEPEPLGTAGALRLALPLVRSDPALVMNGDSYCDADLRAFWAWHRTQSAAGSLLLTQVADTSRYGRVQLDGSGAVANFQEKAAASGPGWINAGIYTLGQTLLASIPLGWEVSIERVVFPAWIGRGLYGCPAGGRFLDFGTPEGLAQLPAFLAEQPHDGT